MELKLSIASLALFCMSLAACSTNEAQGETLILTDSIQELRMDLRINDTVEYEGQKLTLTEIVDSRCPQDENVDCDSAGLVDLTLTLRQTDGSSQTVHWSYTWDGMGYYPENDTTGVSGPFLFGNFDLQVVSVEPYPTELERTHQPEEFIVHVLIQQLHP